MVHRDEITVKVAQEVAKKEGVDPLDLQPPLYSAVDTEAMGRLFRPTSKSARDGGGVKFEYRGHTIEVTASGDVDV